MKLYSIAEVAKLSGVSIRTLHVYDKMGLLKPAKRTETNYRKYSESELLRLQQILFYKELEMPLKEIAAILNEPDFKILEALTTHKKAIEFKQNRLSKMLETIQKTIDNLTNNKEMRHEELYEGISKEFAEAYRNEAIAKWGEETIESSERQLLKLTKSGFENLKNEFLEINSQIQKKVNLQPESEEVQSLISKHYDCICQFWGSKPFHKAYRGLGEMYISDTRYTTINNKPSLEFAKFMLAAMTFFADENLKN